MQQSEQHGALSHATPEAETETPPVLEIIEQFLPEDCYDHRHMRPVEGIVIHYFSAKNVDREHRFEIDTCIKLFKELNLDGDGRGDLLECRPGDKRFYASAHFLVGREGEIIQLVPLEHRAFHAGKSEWAGMTNCNAFMYGIEFIATHNSGYTDDQYMSGAALCAHLREQWQFPLKNIVGHEHVSPGRKQDPGPKWDWGRFFGLLSDVVPG